VTPSLIRRAEPQMNERVHPKRDSR
jgi:hypothetical protein